MDQEDQSGRLTKSFITIETSISLLAQRVQYLETDLKRLGDKLRDLDTIVRTVERNYHETYKSRGDAIETLQKKFESMDNRFWTFFLSLSGGMLLFMIQQSLRK